MKYTKENFARYLGPGQIIRRRNLSVHVAHTRLRQGSDGQAARDQPRQSSATPDSAAPPSLKLRRAGIAEAKRRFDICKFCEHSRDNAFACALHPACCFGRFRSNMENHCPQTSW